VQVQTIEINSIIVDEKIQQRADLNDDYIDELSIEITEGANLPPLDVYAIDGDLLLTDGFHRLKALLKAGFDTVEVNIFEGTERDAVLHAVGANATHGLRRTNADKRKAVTTLLKDEEWGRLSDGQIAEICRVSQPFVSKVSNELTQNGFERNSQRLGKDGRYTDTANVGPKGQNMESEDSSTIEESGSPETEVETTNTNENEDPHSSEENDVESSPDSDSDDATGTDDESSDQTEEGNIGPDGDDVDGDSESTSDDNNEEESIPASSPEEQVTHEEDEEPEPDSNDPSSEEATEDDADDNGSPESEANESQPSLVELLQTDEVPALRSKIAELENTIADKDQRIEELEAKNAELQERIKELEEQHETSDDYVDSIEDFEPAGGLSGSTIY
jgi:hypothetical protein